MRTIEISDANYKELSNQAQPFEETTPDMVLTRLLKTNNIRSIIQDINQPTAFKKTSEGLKAKRKLGRTVLPNIITLLSSSGAMTFPEIIEEFNRNWEIYFTTSLTEEEKTMTKGPGPGLMQSWKHKIHNSLQGAVNAKKLTCINERYIIPSPGETL